MRAELLATASDLVAREGLAGLSLHAVARGVGCSTPALYRYFPDKASLLLALQAGAIASLHAELAAVLQRSRAAAPRGADADSATAALRHLVQALAFVWADHSANPPRHRLIDELLSAPAPLLDDARLEEANALAAPLLELVGTLFAEAVRAGALDAGDPQARTRLAWAALHGLGHFRKRDRVETRALRTDALFRDLLATLLAGWGAKPKKVAKALG
jgi:AcrR family transcriptional regulator